MLEKELREMDYDEKKRLIKIVVLIIVQSFIIIGIINCPEIQGLPLIVCLGIKAVAILSLIIASIFLIKEIKELLR